MLVLTRKVGQRIMLGPSVELLVVGIRGQKVRLGVTAPAEIPVIREEIQNKGRDDGLRRSLRAPAPPRTELESQGIIQTRDESHRQ